MKTSILSALFCRYSLDRTFEAVSRIGYDGLDIHGARPHAYPYDMDAARVREVLALKKRFGLELPMYTPEILAYPYNIPSADRIEREETLRYLEKAIEVCAAMEIPLMQITCGHAGHHTKRAENFRNIYAVMTPLVKKAEACGVTLILEALTIMESNTVVFVDDLVEVLDYFDSPHLKAMMDTVTPIVHREAFADHFEKLGDRLAYMHFVDSNGQDQSHLPLKTGVIDLPALIDTTRHYGYDGWFCIEIIGKYIHEPETHAARELRALKSLLVERRVNPSAV
ncbi:MAG: TIM barrel protein [Clostridiales Family XIII bacterium]|jgi:protein FrlC|nr:TIM barrel protein [Clostridiales Family XIII bacterium]